MNKQNILAVVGFVLLNHNLLAVASNDFPPLAAAEGPAATTTADVIIIGAGISGLAAAHNLTQAGLRVAMLEARNRTGGRLQSVETVAGGWYAILLLVDSDHVHCLFSVAIEFPAVQYLEQCMDCYSISMWGTHKKLTNEVQQPRTNLSLPPCLRCRRKVLAIHLIC